MAKTLTTEEVAQRIKETFKQDVELVSEYQSRRNPITLHCNDCGYEWSTMAGCVLYGEKHECINCGLHTKQVNIFYCANCGKELNRRDSAVKKNKSGYAVFDLSRPDFVCSRMV